MIVFESEEHVFMTDLPWYIMNPKNTSYKLIDTVIQVMTWISVTLTPLTMVFDMMGSQMQPKVLWLYWAIDIAWCLQILICFFVASSNNRNFKSTSKSYLRGYFIFDVVATVPSMITMQQNASVNLLKFLRFVHVGEMFIPFKRLIDCLMEGKIQRKRSDMLKLIVLFVSILLFGHLMACSWIALGAREDGWITML